MADDTPPPRKADKLAHRSRGAAPAAANPDSSGDPLAELACNICNIRPEDLSVWQWRYLLVVQEFLEARRLPTLIECCKAARIHRTTVWRWFQDRRFLNAYYRVFCAHVDVRNAMVDFAIQTAAIAGNPRAWEANLRSRGLWNGSRFDQEGEMPPGRSSPSQVQVGVQFVGLPASPTPQQAEAMRPPPGSAMVVTAAGVLEDRSRKPGRSGR